MGISHLDLFIIRVTIGRGRVLVLPKTAEVAQGTKVRFELDVEDDVPDIEAEIYFKKEAAFAWRAEKIRVPAGTSGLPARRIEASADKPGEFEYGVRGTTTAENVIIADDDPWLIVRPSGGLRPGELKGAPVPWIIAGRDPMVR